MTGLRQGASIWVFDDNAPWVSLDEDLSCAAGEEYVALGCLSAVPSLWVVGRDGSEHGVLFIGIGIQNGRCLNGKAYGSVVDETDLEMELWVVGVCCIWEVEHLKRHGPCSVEVEGLSGRESEAFPGELTLSVGIEGDEAIGTEVGVGKVGEIGANIDGLALEVWDLRVHLNLGLKRCGQGRQHCQSGQSQSGE